jgi:biopolymer transport protein ExbD
MRRPSSFLSRRTPIDLQMTPMIDCVFLLMVYFIWASSFVPPEMTLPSHLAAQLAGAGQSSASETPPPEADFEKVVVRVLEGNGHVTWEVNGAGVPSLAQLLVTMQQIANIKADAPVVIHPDRPVPVGDVIDVFDLARLAGFEKVQFAAAEN